VEIPCEFCNELYPFELLMEHQSSCRPDLLHFNFDDEVAPIAPVATISPKAPSPPKVTEAKQKSPDLPKAPVLSPISKGTNNIASVGKQNKEDKTPPKVDPFEDLLKDDDDEIPIIFEDNSQGNKGEVTIFLPFSNKLLSLASTLEKGLCSQEAK
ncbi:hypothetical protein AVEN_226662-1, partial [Araneus ventricosus]